MIPVKVIGARMGKGAQKEEWTANVRTENGRHGWNGGPKNLKNGLVLQKD